MNKKSKTNNKGYSQKGKRISNRRKFYGGVEPKDIKRHGWINAVKSCPNETQPDLKWKYGAECFKDCSETPEKTFPISWDDDHAQRTCEADTTENRARYYATHFPLSTAYKAARVGTKAAIAAAPYVRDGAIKVAEKGKDALKCVGDVCYRFAEALYNDEEEPFLMI